MSDPSSSVSTQSRASPWPLFVAVGFALSEVGVFLGIRPVSVAGLLLFVGSIAGILRESGYVTRPVRVLGLEGLALVGIGIGLIFEAQAGTTVRGQSIIIAGILSIVGVLLWTGYVRTRASDRTETTDGMSDH